MRLQQPRTVYSSHDEIERNRQIELADLQNHKRGQDLTVAPGRLILADETSGTQYEVYVDNSALLIRELGGLAVTTDADILQAERVVLAQYGDTVSVAAKAKNLNKFGRTSTNVGTTFATIAEFQGSVADETFVTTNLIDSVSSSSASDTMDVTIQGHTVDVSGNMTFVSQTVTLAGQTEVPLPTPMARASRMFVANDGTFGNVAPDAVGTIAVYDNTDGIAAGVPNTDAATKMLIAPGETQSEKCAVTTASDEYWFLTTFTAQVYEAAATTDFVTVRIEIRDIVNGGAWRPIGGDVVAVPGIFTAPPSRFSPFLIVPKNHDIRAIAKTDAGTAPVEAEITGYLAAVQ